MFWHDYEEKFLAALVRGRGEAGYAFDDEVKHILRAMRRRALLPRLWVYLRIWWSGKK
jgi:hypothetical protein